MRHIFPAAGHKGRHVPEGRQHLNEGVECALHCAPTVVTIYKFRTTLDSPGRFVEENQASLTSGPPMTSQVRSKKKG